MTALTLRVFISSPGDVGEERVQASRVLERLEGEFGGVVRLEPILWEHEPLRATGDFPEEITPPSATDIVICILWSRLGTRLPERYRREDGTPYTGTGWEIDDAIRSYRVNGKPALLVYRKEAERFASIDDENAFREQVEQRKLLESFINERFRNPDGSFKAAFHPFKTLQEFEQRLEEHLRKLIQDRLPEHRADEPHAPVPIRWYDGSPYRGLQVFDMIHAPIFFGRTRAIAEIKTALIRQAAAGCAFVLVFGMSGCGKSSLVRAGLLPTLTQPGVIEGIGLWRWSLLRPSGAAGDLFDGLAAALLAKEALPELQSDGFHAGELAALFREAPRRAVAPIRMGLERIAGAVAEREALEHPPAARLAVVVDQLEELFTLERLGRADAASGEREGFVAALSALAHSGAVWVIGTMRSDFLDHCAALPELARLKEGTGQYHLLPPTPAEIAQMICYPAFAAGLRFDRDPHSGERLDEVLHEAAARDRGALPLLEFTLDELFEQRTKDNVLTFAAYERLERMEGALAKRAEAVLARLAEPVRAALSSLLRELVTVGQSDENQVAARRVPLKSLDAPPERAALRDAFIEARLLVTDRADDGQAVVGIVHEALLRHWPRAKDCLERDREFLRKRERVAEDAAEWWQKGKPSDLLLPLGTRLEEGKGLLARRADLDARLVEYAEESIRKAARAHRRRLSALSVIATAILAFSIFSSYEWRRAERQADMTLQAIDGLIRGTQRIGGALKGVSKETSLPVWSAMADMYQGNHEQLSKMPDAPGTKRARAVNLQLLANNLSRQSLLEKDETRQKDQLQRALVACEECLAIGQDLAAHSQNLVDQRNLAVYYDTFGDVLRVAGDTGEALNNYKNSLGIYLKLATDRRDIAAQRDVWFESLQIGDCQYRLNAEEALETYKKCKERAENMAKDKTNLQAQMDLAASYVRMGNVLGARGRWPEALAAYQKSLQQMHKMPEDKRDIGFTQDLKAISARVSSLRRELGRRGKNTGGH